MPRRRPAMVLLAGLLLAAASIAAAESPQASARRSVAEPVRSSAPDAAHAAAPAASRKPLGRQAAAVRKTTRSPTKAPSPMLDEKNLGLGCAQG